MSMAGGYAMSASEESIDQGNNIEYLIHQLKKNSGTMGLTNEVRSLLEEVENIKYNLEVKNMELSVLEAIAMESNDENVVELREQLFSLVKMIYSDKIHELSNQTIKQQRLEPSPMFNGVEAKPLNYKNKETISNGSVFDRIHSFFRIRNKHKKGIAQLNNIDDFST